VGFPGGGDLAPRGSRLKGGTMQDALGLIFTPLHPVFAAECSPGKGVRNLYPLKRFLTPFQAKKAKVRVSMLSRGGAPGGVAGSSNALCAVKRESLLASESNTLNTSASSRVIWGK